MNIKYGTNVFEDRAYSDLYEIKVNIYQPLN